MNKKIKQAWIILTVVVGVFIAACVSASLSEEIGQGESPIAGSKNHWYYDFTDEQIQSAITQGAQSDHSDMFQEEFRHLIKVSDNQLIEMKKNPPLVYFYTPTFQMIKRSYEDSQKMITTTVEDIRNATNTIDNFLYFSIEAGTNDPAIAREFHAVLRQGDVTIQPIGGSLTDLDDPPVKVFSPGEGQPKYTKYVGAGFMIDDRIDLKELLYLTFIYSDKNDTATYEIIPSQQR
ncbi:hypothetical protein P4H71_05150 [Paenibacillus kribbensis]|uniref:hypothetical protein n=1 Tax=Paenibacillus kribbensis TaxID=172713 RepID=UPI002DB7FEA8|nr:hypothetical protein [Paenibacillus kribbensis]MEC0233743.1 hypothetical protein [Paenibacillus kribbensis]